MSRTLPLLDRMTVDDLMYAQSIHKVGKQTADWMASQPKTKNFPRPTPEQPLIISVSELGSWLRCRVKHHWGSQCGLEQVTTREPLVMGSLGHDIQEAWYGSASSWKERDVRSMERISKKLIKAVPVTKLPLESKNLLRAMVVGYANWVRSPDEEHSDRNIGLNACIPERKFVLPLDEKKTLLVRGKLDNFFEPSAFKKTVATLETKFKAKIEYDNVERLIQLTVYIWAMMQLYPKARRFITYYQILRKQMPTPRVRTPLFYRDAIERSPEEVFQWARDTRYALKDMIGAAVYANPMDSCSWGCDFRVPCLLRGDKASLKHVLSSEFQVRARAEEAKKKNAR